MLLRTEGGDPVKITSVHFGESPADTELLEGYYVDTDIPLTSRELEELTEVNFDYLTQVWIDAEEGV